METMTPTRDARLGAAIRTRRIQLGLSQVALGERVGTSGQQLQKYEKGANQVAFPMLVEIAAALGIYAPELVADALGERNTVPTGGSDRQTLELMKRLALLSPNQRRGVRLLVQSLVAEERPPGWSVCSHGVGTAKPRELGGHVGVLSYPAKNDQQEG